MHCNLGLFYLISLQQSWHSEYLPSHPEHVAHVRRRQRTRAQNWPKTMPHCALGQLVNQKHWLWLPTRLGKVDLCEWSWHKGWIYSCLVCHQPHICHLWRRWKQFHQVKKKPPQLYCFEQKTVFCRDFPQFGVENFEVSNCVGVKNIVTGETSQAITSLTIFTI